MDKHYLCYEHCVLKLSLNFTWSIKIRASTVKAMSCWSTGWPGLLSAAAGQCWSGHKQGTRSYIHTHGTLQETPQRTPCKSPLRLRSLFRLLPRRLTTFKKTAQQQAIMAATLCCRGSPSCLAKMVQQSAVQHWARAWTQFEAEATQ